MSKIAYKKIAYHYWRPERICWEAAAPCLQLEEAMKSLPMDNGDHEGVAGFSQVSGEDCSRPHPNAADGPQLGRTATRLPQQQCHNRANAPWHCTLDELRFTKMRDKQGRPHAGSFRCLAPLKAG